MADLTSDYWRRPLPWRYVLTAAMLPGSWGRLLGATIATIVVGAGCASGGDDSPLGASPSDGSALETSGEASSSGDSTPSMDDAGSTDDSSAPTPDGSATDSTAPPDDGPTPDSAPAPDAGSDSSAPAGDGGPPMDATQRDSSPPADATPPDTGRPDVGTGDAASCPLGPNPSYQRSCAGCAVSATCLLTCATCTKQDQTENANPSLQLPCAGTTSPTNINGVLVCQ
jgi:hypothetical protein